MNFNRPWNDVCQLFERNNQFTLFVFFNLGGSISLIRLIACKGGSLKKGGSPSTISITIIPVFRD